MRAVNNKDKNCCDGYIGDNRQSLSTVVVSVDREVDEVLTTKQCRLLEQSLQKAGARARG